MFLAQRSYGLGDYCVCELGVQFRGDRNHVGMAGEELLEEPSYSVVSARVATGTNRDYRRTGTSWRNGRPCPIRKGPHVQGSVGHGVGLESYRSITVIA